LTSIKPPAGLPVATALQANWIATHTKRNDVVALTAKALEGGARHAGDDEFCRALMSFL
jgi:hypothetical protein